MFIITEVSVKQLNPNISGTLAGDFFMSFAIFSGY